MLVLKRRRGQRVVITVTPPGSDPVVITIKINSTATGSCSLAFDSPRDTVSVVREEIAP